MGLLCYTKPSTLVPFLRLLRVPHLTHAGYGEPVQELRVATSSWERHCARRSFLLWRSWLWPTDLSGVCNIAREELDVENINIYSHTSLQSEWPWNYRPLFPSSSGIKSAQDPAEGDENTTDANKSLEKNWTSCLVCPYSELWNLPSPGSCVINKEVYINPWVRMI